MLSEKRGSATTKWTLHSVAQVPARELLIRCNGCGMAGSHSREHEQPASAEFVFGHGHGFEIPHAALHVNDSYVHYRSKEGLREYPYGSDREKQSIGVCSRGSSPIPSSRVLDGSAAHEATSWPKLLQAAQPGQG